MWENTKAELDALFFKNNNVMVERRRNGRWNDFSAHVEFLQSFAAVQSRVIRPVMINFGKYVETMGHKHYLESAEELVDGYILPMSHIALHLLLNMNHDPMQRASHSITFKTDSSRTVYLYLKTGGYAADKSGLSTNSRYSVGRYHINEITPELVHTHLKQFVIEAVLGKPQQLVAKSERQGGTVSAALA